MKIRVLLFLRGAKSNRQRETLHLVLAFSYLSVIGNVVLK
jgi:hypothetical protein